MPAYIKTDTGTEQIISSHKYGTTTENFKNKNMVIRCGYKEITGISSASRIPLFTSTELSSMLGVTVSDPYKVIVVVQNSSSSLQDAHLLACGYLGSLSYKGTTYSNVWCIQADRNISGTLACSYVVIYYTDQGTSPGIYIRTRSGASEIIQTGYDARDLQKMICGTTVINPSNNNSFKIADESSMNALVGSGSNATNTLCYFTNGDGNANGAHIDGCTYVPSDKTWRVVWQNGTSVSGSYRVNYMIFRW